MKKWFLSLLYSNKLKNWEFDKEVPPIFQIGRAAVFIDTERGVGEKAVEKPMWSKTNSSICLSIIPIPRNKVIKGTIDFAEIQAWRSKATSGSCRERRRRIAGKRCLQFMTLFLGIGIIPSFCFALEEDPWFGNCFELHFRPLYEYNYFDRVDHSAPSQKENFNTHLVNFGLGVTAPETWDWEMEVEFADTTPISFGYRSFAFQIRKLWWDDVCGDPVSLSTGLVYRDASSRLRDALSTPYHARVNFELHTAIGKEWSHGHDWTFRIYTFAAVGQGTEGSPWLRGDLYLWGNLHDCHQFRLFGMSYWGLGSQKTVPIDDFNGWAKIGHRSIDVGASYRYRLGVYGWFRFDYMRRVYARSYPEQVNFFIFSFDMPFSIF